MVRKTRARSILLEPRLSRTATEKQSCGESATDAGLCPPEVKLPCVLCAHIGWEPMPQMHSDTLGAFRQPNSQPEPSRMDAPTSSLPACCSCGVSEGEWHQRIGVG